MSLPRIFINRVNIEAKKLSQDLPPEITCWSEEEDKLGNFRAVMKGPLDSPYAGGIFTLRIVLPVRYPYDPPKVNFLTRIYHPNVDDNGRICLDILKSLPKGSWTSGQSIMSTLMSIYSLLSNPNADDPLDIEAATLFKNDRLLFNETVKKFTSLYATGKDTEKIISDDPTPQPLATKEIESRELRSKASFSLKKNKKTAPKIESRDTQQPNLPSAVVAPSTSTTSNKSGSKIFSLKKLKAQRDSSPTEPTLPKSLSQLSSEGLPGTSTKETVAPKYESEELEQTSNETHASRSASLFNINTGLKTSKSKTLTSSPKCVIKTHSKSVSTKVESAFNSVKAPKVLAKSGCFSDHDQGLALAENNQPFEGKSSNKDTKSKMARFQKTNTLPSPKNYELSQVNNSNPDKLSKVSHEANEIVNNKFRKPKSKNVLVSDSSADESPSDIVSFIKEATSAVSDESKASEPLSKETVISKPKQSSNSITPQIKDFSSTNDSSSEKYSPNFVSIDRQRSASGPLFSKNDDLITMTVNGSTSHNSSMISDEQSKTLPKFIKRLPTPNLNAPPHPMKALYDILKSSGSKKKSQFNITEQEDWSQNPKELFVSLNDRHDHPKKSVVDIPVSCSISNPSEVSPETLENTIPYTDARTLKLVQLVSQSFRRPGESISLSPGDLKTTSLSSDLTQDPLYSDEDLYPKKKRGWRPSPLRPTSQPRRPTFSLKKLRRE